MAKTFEENLFWQLACINYGKVEHVEVTRWPTHLIWTIYFFCSINDWNGATIWPRHWHLKKLYLQLACINYDWTYWSYKVADTFNLNHLFFCSLNGWNDVKRWLTYIWTDIFLPWGTISASYIKTSRCVMYLSSQKIVQLSWLIS